MGDRVDAVVAGGGPAGLNAALVLVRARRSVVICDDGAPRNQASHAMHNYLSRDGMDPAELLRAGRDEISRYPGARFLRCTVDDVQRAGDGFRATASTGEVIEARKVLLAVGIKDWLPPIAGFDEMYGRSVFHCQYCDGWSARDLPLAVLSEREREVLHLLAEGKSNKEVANVLNLSVYTVETHRGNLMEKLKLKGVPELILYAVRKGIIA